MLKQKIASYLLIFFLLCIIVFISSSCSHQVIKQCPCSDNKIKQTLKVKVLHKDEKNKITVYSKINRENETAVLEGIGPLGKHIFTLNVYGSMYELTDRVNNKSFSGNIEEFSIIPLTKDLIFSKIDINEPQPIIIKDEQRETEVEITVSKQETED